MEKKLLLITKNDSTFLIRALIKSLSDGGYEVITSIPDMECIQALKMEGILPDIILVYLEDYEDKYEELFTYLKKVIILDGTRRYLYLIGNEIEFTAVYKYIAKKWITFAFTRPVNSAELIKQIESFSADYSYELDEADGDVPMRHKRSLYSYDPQKQTILLVDDDTTFLKGMERWLVKDYNVFTASSGMDTISFLKKRTVNLILLDYEMPVLSGLEVFQMLKSEPATENIPVIFLTSKDDKKTVVEVLAAGPENYLLKTKPPAVLMQDIQKFFESRTPRSSALKIPGVKQIPAKQV